jgi:hypothetical protein
MLHLVLQDPQEAQEVQDHPVVTVALIFIHNLHLHLFG